MSFKQHLLGMSADTIYPFLFFLIKGRVRQDTRAALLTSKRAIDSQSSSQREELLRASAANEKHDLDENRTWVSDFLQSNYLPDSITFTVMMH